MKLTLIILVVLNPILLFGQVSRLNDTREPYFIEAEKLIENCSHSKKNTRALSKLYSKVYSSILNIQDFNQPTNYRTTNYKDSFKYVYGHNQGAWLKPNYDTLFEVINFLNDFDRSKELLHIIEYDTVKGFSGYSLDSNSSVLSFVSQKRQKYKNGNLMSLSNDKYDSISQAFYPYIANDYSYNEDNLVDTIFSVYEKKGGRRDTTSMYVNTYKDGLKTRYEIFGYNIDSNKLLPYKKEEMFYNRKGQRVFYTFSEFYLSTNSYRKKYEDSTYYPDSNTIEIVARSAVWGNPADNFYDRKDVYHIEDNRITNVEYFNRDGTNRVWTLWDSFSLNYNANGKLVNSISSSGSQTKFDRDAKDNIVHVSIKSEFEPLDFFNSFLYYDSLDRLIKQTDTSSMNVLNQFMKRSIDYNYVEKLDSDTSIISIFSIFPNPVIKEFEVKLNAQEYFVSNILLSDIIGRKVKVFDKVNYLKPPMRFDCSDISSGIYYLNFQTNRKLYQTKILKE